RLALVKETLWCWRSTATRALSYARPGESTNFRTSSLAWPAVRRSLQLCSARVLRRAALSSRCNHMVGQDDTGCTMARRNSHFEWVSFRLIRDGAYQRQPKGMV